VNESEPMWPLQHAASGVSPGYTTTPVPRLPSMIGDGCHKRDHRGLPGRRCCRKSASAQLAGSCGTGTAMGREVHDPPDAFSTSAMNSAPKPVRADTQPATAARNLSSAGGRKGIWLTSAARAPWRRRRRRESFRVLLGQTSIPAGADAGGVHRSDIVRRAPAKVAEASAAEARNAQPHACASARPKACRAPHPLKPIVRPHPRPDGGGVSESARRTIGRQYGAAPFSLHMAVQCRRRDMTAQDRSSAGSRNLSAIGCIDEGCSERWCLTKRPHSNAAAAPLRIGAVTRNAMPAYRGSATDSRMASTTRPTGNAIKCVQTYAASAPSPGANGLQVKIMVAAATLPRRAPMAGYRHGRKGFLGNDPAAPGP
jgi:hypothetical protein